MSKIRKKSQSLVCSEKILVAIKSLVVYVEVVITSYLNRKINKTEINQEYESTPP